MCSVLLQNLRGFQLVKKFLHFMEHQSSLLCSEQRATCPNPRPDEYSPHPPSHILFKIHFSIILPSMPRYSKWSLLSGFPTKTFSACLVYAMHITCLTHVFLLHENSCLNYKFPSVFNTNPRLSGIFNQHSFPSHAGQVAQSLYRLTTGWTVRDRIPVGMRFSAHPDWPWGPPSLLYNGYQVFPGGKVQPGRAADHSPPSSAAIMEE